MAVSHLPTALLLDLDGTLVDSEPIHRQGFRDWFAHRGWPVDERTLNLFTGRRADDVFASIEGPWSGEDPAALFAEVVGFVPTDVRPTPIAGAHDLLDWAAGSGVPLALVTSADHRWANAALEALGGIGRFAAVVTRDEVGRGKPDPAGYLLACRLLGVEASRAAAFEDSPAGVRAAVRARVGQVVGVTTTWSAQELQEAGATHTAADLAEAIEDLSLV